MGKVYATADWHGNGKLANMVLDWLKPDDKLYFLGDATDRGPDGIQIMDRLLKDNRIIYLKGNHEDFINICVPYLLKIENNEWVERNARQWCCQWLYENGGYYTWNALKDKTKEEITWYIDKIKNMPLQEEYISNAGNHIILEHAGFTPCSIPRRTHDPLWDREHFLDSWEGSEDSNVFLVHGHTPVQYLKYQYGYDGKPQFTEKDYINKRKWFQNDSYNEKLNIIRYCDRHKFDIDMCTVITNRIALLDLDTFEEIYFG